MSVVCSRLALPAVSSVSGRCLRLRAPFTRLLHLTTTADAKHLAQATALSPEDNSQFPTLHPDKRSLPTFESLSSHQKDQITLYVRTLLQWNQTMNLTAVTEESEVMTRHVEDSLAILPPLRRSYLSHFRGASSWDGLNVIDVGSGAGLPGLVLAIACPSWKITLLESMKKRCSFLEHIVALTGLSNVQILCERAENIGQCADFRELFDVAVARAVAEMRILAEYCLPLVHVGGLFLAAKGSDPQWNHLVQKDNELLLSVQKTGQRQGSILGNLVHRQKCRYEVTCKFEPLIFCCIFEPEGIASYWSNMLNRLCLLSCPDKCFIDLQVGAIHSILGCSSAPTKRTAGNLINDLEL